MDWTKTTEPLNIAIPVEFFKMSTNNYFLVPQNLENIILNKHPFYTYHHHTKLNCTYFFETPCIIASRACYFTCRVRLALLKAILLLRRGRPRADWGGILPEFLCRKRTHFPIPPGGLNPLPAADIGKWIRTIDCFLRLSRSG